MRFYIETLGCKVNQYETQALESTLASRGHVLSSPGEGCDVIIVNTCAVTAESGRKSRQAVRRLKRIEPDAYVAVCGCFAQLEPESLSFEADFVSGSGDRLGFLEELERNFEKRRRNIRVDDPRYRHEFEVLPAGSLAGRTRAMLKIQDGCSNFCSYCVIPYTRGPVRSMPLGEVSAQCTKLHSDGFSEIVITGIEISSYGKDLSGGVSLIDAVQAASTAAPGVRLHLGSLEPRTITEDFCRAAAEILKLCPHFHLSLQSGCDAVLMRMKRKYDTARFYESVQLLRRFFPDCGITTDLIVGFPGETEQEFGETLEFIQKCGFSAMHVFPYSRRPGTPAAAMPDQVPNAEKARRAAIARDAAGKMSQQFAERMCGKTLSVLFEQEEDGVSVGRSENYLTVTVNEANLRGCVLDVQIQGQNGSALWGKICLPQV